MPCGCCASSAVHGSTPHTSAVTACFVRSLIMRSPRAVSSRRQRRHLPYRMRERTIPINTATSSGNRKRPRDVRRVSFRKGRGVSTRYVRDSTRSPRSPVRFHDPEPLHSPIQVRAVRLKPPRRLGDVAARHREGSGDEHALVLVERVRQRCVEHGRVRKRGGLRQTHWARSAAPRESRRS